MIVNKSKSGWEIIQQPAHALLAMEICTRLDLSNFSTSEYTAIQAAIALHDDQEAYYNHGSYLSEEGTPLDFCFLPMNDPMRTKQAKRIIRGGFLKSSLVGCLILEHYFQLYREKDIQNEMKAALDEGQIRINKLKEDGKVSKEQIEKCYAVMGFCDRLSLTLCKNDIPEMDRLLEIGFLHSVGETVFLKRENNEVLICSPWPFAESSIEIFVETYQTRELTFDSDEQLKEYLHDQLPEKKHFKFEHKRR